jgi:large subunit ribosomal protein L19
MKLQNIINTIENYQIKSDLPDIYVGDTVRIDVLIQEGNKQRIQPYEGTIIAKHSAHLNTTITVRRIFQGIGVERIFALHSPCIQNIKIIRHAKVRKAKLYYLRDRIGKATRLKERFYSTFGKSAGLKKI